MSTRLRSILPWLISLVLLAILCLFIGVGWWRGTGIGPQIQVPMFYDAHYLFPRPWTQEQAAPGVPAPAPLAFYGPNRVSQSFVSGVDNLTMIELWLAGPQDTAVTATLTNKTATFTTDIPLKHGPSGGLYWLTFPPIVDAKGQTFDLTLIAPETTAVTPVVTKTVGGDRLGGSWRLNEYPKPGNIALQTYVDGRFDASWLAAVGEQLLPTPFRLRVQQYKPQPVKGLFFPLLVGITAGLSFLFLILARPHKTLSLNMLQRSLGWGVAVLLALFLLWQIGDGRIRLPIRTSALVMQPTTDLAQTVSLPAERLINDFTATLWTAEREPEARFVSTAVVDGRPAIQVPTASVLRFALTVPRNGRFRAGFAAQGDGLLQATVRVGDEIVAQEVATAVADPTSSITWLELDLTPWAGQGTVISLETHPQDGSPTGLWLMPQLTAQVDWLLPDTAPLATAVQPAGQRFAATVALVGYTIENEALQTLNITLYWRPLQPASQQATIFIHLLNAAGEIVAQQDAQPVDGTYPLPNWQPGTIIVDTHKIILPDESEGPLTVTVGLYDPQTLLRWPVVDAAGQPLSDGRILLDDAQ